MIRVAYIFVHSASLLLVVGLHAQTALESPNFSISGQVVNDITKDTIPNALVVLQAMSGDLPHQVAARTSADGYFSLAGLSPGEYVLLANSPGFLAARYRGPLSVGDEALHLKDNVEGISIGLTPWSVLTGTVAGPDGVPLIGAQVSVIQMNLVEGRFGMKMIGKVSTNDLGHYRVFAIPPGRYYISAYYRDSLSTFGLHAVRSDVGTSTFDYAETYYPGTQSPALARYVDVVAGETRSDLNIMLEMTRSTTVSGTIMNRPEGSDVAVLLEPADPMALGVRQAASASAASGGRFSFVSIPPGDYRITANLPLGDRTLVAREWFAVGNADVSQLQLDLHDVPSVTGQVLPRGNQSVSPDIRLRIVGSDPRMAFDVPLDDEGRFNLEELFPDDYQFRIEGGSSEIVDEIRIADKVIAGRSLRIDGSVESLTIIVSTDGGEISGTMSNRAGDPAPGGLVVAVPSEPEEGDWRLARSDSQGNFSFKSVLPGTYRLVGLTDSKSTDKLTPGELAMKTGAKVLVNRGEKVVAQLTVEP